MSLVVPELSAIVFNYGFGKEEVFTHESLVMGIHSFYYKTVSILIFPLAYYLWNILNRPKKLISAILMLIFLSALFFAGSRGVALSTFGVVAATLCLKVKTIFGPGAVLFVLLIILVISGGLYTIFFNPDNLSNIAKLGHIHSYAMEFDDHPAYLLWGQGTDTEFYSEGFHRKINETELTYIDMIRWFGVPVSALMMIAVLYPAFRLMQQANGMLYLVVPYVAYLLEAATNPLLICSFGALIVSAIWGTFLMRGAKPPVVWPGLGMRYNPPKATT